MVWSVQVLSSYMLLVAMVSRNGTGWSNLGGLLGFIFITPVLMILTLLSILLSTALHQRYSQSPSTVTVMTATKTISFAVNAVAVVAMVGVLVTFVISAQSFNCKSTKYGSVCEAKPTQNVAPR